MASTRSAGFNTTVACRVRTLDLPHSRVEEETGAPDVGDCSSVHLFSGQSSAGNIPGIQALEDIEWPSPPGRAVDRPSSAFSSISMAESRSETRACVQELVPPEKGEQAGTFLEGWRPSVDRKSPNSRAPPRSILQTPAMAGKNPWIGEWHLLLEIQIRWSREMSFHGFRPAILARPVVNTRQTRDLADPTMDE